ncbi:MAG: hypothetical protein AMXMBFR52_00020 [Burkholderiales bacterium]|jgi:protein TonB
MDAVTTTGRRHDARLFCYECLAFAYANVYHSRFDRPIARHPVSASLAFPVPNAFAPLPRSARTAVVLAMVAVHALAVFWLMQRVPAAAHLAAGRPAPIFAELIRPPAPEAPRVVPRPDAAPDAPREVRPAPPVPRPVIARKKATPRPAETAFVTPPAPAPEPLPAKADTPTPAPAEPAAAVTPHESRHAPTLATAPAPAPPTPAPKSLSIRAVEYLSLPVLRYPNASRRMMEEGRVEVRVLVDVAGAPRETVVVHSSGYPRLDEAALATVRATRFKPYAENGVPMPFWVVMPLIFELES